MVAVRQLKAYAVSILLALLVMAGSSPLGAQSATGTIAGTVTDPTGAVVAGARIKAVNSATGAQFETVSSSSGAYRFDSVGIGTYDISVTAPGFSEAAQKGLEVQVATLTPLNIELKVGSTTDVVNVDVSAPTVQTETSDVGDVITSRQNIDLPLSLGGVGATRSPEAFVFLIPGTVGPGTNNGSGGVNQSKITGGQNYSTEVLLDGNDTYLTQNGSSFDQTAPSVDALSEFRVLTSTLPAEYGRTTGGIESFSTKNGTNAFHGAIYEIFQNEDLNANNFFNNYFSQPRATDKKNNFGITLGGPFRVPHLYDGRDKSFFFFSFEQFRQSLGATNTSTVPTAAERGGDLSAFLTGLPVLDSNNSAIINPCTGTPVEQGQIYDPSTTRTVGGEVCRTPFAGNIIPAADLDPVAQNILSYIPLPQTSSAHNNYFNVGSYPITNTLITVRIDQNIGVKHKAFFSYSSRENSVGGVGNFKTPAGGYSLTYFPTHYFRFGETYAIAPTLLNTINVGYNRTISDTLPSTYADGVDYPTKVGITGLNSRSFPNINPGEGFTGVGESVDDVIADNGYRINEALDIVKGRHSIKVGTDLRYQVFFPNFRDHNSGIFNYGRGQTAATIATNATSGNSFGSFLLGYTQEQEAIIYTTAPKWVQSYYAYFAEDDWKVAKTLTLNLGFRWDTDVPRYEAHGNYSNLSLTTPNPGAGDIPGALIFAGVGPGRTGSLHQRFVNVWHKDFAPRVGFAYAPAYLHGKTAIRGGFGIYYGAPLSADNGNLLRTGFQATPQIAVVNSFDASYALRNGFPQTYAGTNQPTYQPPPSLDPTQVNGGEPYYLSPAYGRPSMTPNWSLDIQQELAKDVILKVGYVGQHSTHLHSAYDPVDALPQRYFALGNLLNADINSPAAVAAGIKAPYAGFVGNVAQALRPLPQYNGVNTDCCLENLGQSSYDALQTSLESRYKDGLTLLASYTWQKTFTDSDSALPIFATFAGGGSPQDPFNHKADKSISDQDISHTFVVSYLYELPVGKGKKYLATTPVLNRVVEGVELGGVLRYQSGQPLAFGGATGIPGIQTGVRYNRVPGQPLLKPGFSTSRFVNPTTDIFNNAALSDPNAGVANGGAYSFGNLSRVTNEVRSQTFLNEDFSFNKRTSISDHFHLLFQAEAFNAFNRHIFNRPDTSGPNSTTFGFINSLINEQGGQFGRLLQLSLRLEY